MSQSRNERSSSGLQKHRVEPLFIPKMIKPRDSEESSDSSEDESKKDDLATESREKRMKSVDTTNPFCTLKMQTTNKKKYFVPSVVIKHKWLYI